MGFLQWVENVLEKSCAKGRAHFSLLLFSFRSDAAYVRGDAVKLGLGFGSFEGSKKEASKQAIERSLQYAERLRRKSAGNFAS